MKKIILLVIASSLMISCSSVGREEFDRIREIQGNQIDALSDVVRDLRSKLSDLNARLTSNGVIPMDQETKDFFGITDVAPNIHDRTVTIQEQRGKLFWSDDIVCYDKHNSKGGK